MPVCWYTQDRVWDLCPGYEEKNDHFSREISRDLRLLSQRADGARPRARNEYREPIPHGIDCERCHGPGSCTSRWARREDEPTGGARSDHRQSRAPAAGAPDAGLLAVPPRGLEGDRAGGATGSGARDWRPGQPISAAMVPFRLRSEPGTTSGSPRKPIACCFRSRCVTASGGRLECLTCHDPHVTVYRADRPADFFREVPDATTPRCKAPDGSRRATTPSPTTASCATCERGAGRPSARDLHRPLDPATNRDAAGRERPNPGHGRTRTFPAASRSLPRRSAHSAPGAPILAGDGCSAPQSASRCGPKPRAALGEAERLGFAGRRCCVLPGEGAERPGTARAEAAEAYDRAASRTRRTRRRSRLGSGASARRPRSTSAERVFEGDGARSSGHPRRAVRSWHGAGLAGDFTEDALALFDKASSASRGRLASTRAPPWSRSAASSGARRAMAEVADAIRLDPESGRIPRSRATLQARRRRRLALEASACG